MCIFCTLQNPAFNSEGGVFVLRETEKFLPYPTTDPGSRYRDALFLLIEFLQVRSFPARKQPRAMPNHRETGAGRPALSRCGRCGHVRGLGRGAVLTCESKPGDNDDNHHNQGDDHSRYPESGHLFLFLLTLLVHNRAGSKISANPHSSAAANVPGVRGKPRPDTLYLQDRAGKLK